MAVWARAYLSLRCNMRHVSPLFSFNTLLFYTETADFVPVRHSGPQHSSSSPDSASPLQSASPAGGPPLCPASPAPPPDYPSLLAPRKGFRVVGVPAHVTHLRVAISSSPPQPPASVSRAQDPSLLKPPAGPASPISFDHLL